MQRMLIIAGLILLFFGVCWPLISSLPMGRLPGDIVIERSGFRFYLPIVTCILISAAVTLLIWLFRR